MVVGCQQTGVYVSLLRGNGLEYVTKNKINFVFSSLVIKQGKIGIMVINQGVQIIYGYKPRQCLYFSYYPRQQNLIFSKIEF